MYSTGFKDAIRYLEDLRVTLLNQLLFVTCISLISRTYDIVLIFTIGMINRQIRPRGVEEYRFSRCGEQVTDSYTNPEAHMMKFYGHFTDLMLKLIHDQPLEL